MLYKISGKVIKGKGYGRKIGFPTANLEFKENRENNFPADGVYAGTGTLGYKIYRAGIVVGPSHKIEVHLIGYSGDAYGKEVMIEINKFIREYKNFDTEEELITQIKKDIELCK